MALAGIAAAAALGLAPAAEGEISSRATLANECVAIRAAINDGFVSPAGADRYRAAEPSARDAAAFHLKPSGRRTYLLHDEDARLLGTAGGSVSRLGDAGSSAEWELRRGAPRRFSLVSSETGRALAVAPGDARLTPASRAMGRRARMFGFVRRSGCARFPEAAVGARGRPSRAEGPRGTVLGFADAHLHITAEMRAGGRVIHGRSFHRYGIADALGGDAVDHGADGSLDVTGNLLRTGLPFGTHDVNGWPSFAGWPVHDTNTHQQVYYRWLKRTWKAGLRLVVAQTIEDEPLCRIEPLRSHPCDETKAIELEVRRLRALERYVDAQNGGPGRGWFRLVYNPRQARRVIERGRLAALIGVESSNPFGCSEVMGRPRCTRADIDRGIERARRLGVRSMFVNHWVNNAFGGAALEGGAKGVFINVFNRFHTGRYFRTRPCPHPSQGEEVTTLSPVELGVLAEFFPATRELAEEGMPAYPAGPQCNQAGLTKLGRYAIRRLMRRGMLIEADHMSVEARERVLRIAERRRYPLVSSHTGTGGAWTPSQLRRLYAIGGFASATPDTAPGLADRILELRRLGSRRHRPRVGLGTDTGGFSSLPGPRGDAAQDPLPYPFLSTDGAVEFVSQRSGERVYDLNTDGVAHYGLFADLLADTRRQPGGERALRVLSRSAEGYLRTWRRAVRSR